MRLTKEQKEQENIISDRSMRDKCVGHYEVLDKVKKLSTLPIINMVTIEQIADYYNVTISHIKNRYKAYKKEIDSIGSKIIPKNFYENYNGCKINKTQSGVTYDFGEGKIVEINNRGLRVFSLDVVVYFSLLLRDSNIANEVKKELGLPVNIQAYRKECVFIDKLDKVLTEMNIVGRKWYPVKSNNGTYHIDYYIEDYGSYTGLAIEYDENNHKNYSYDKQEFRQEFIENKLQCGFLRLSDKDDDETNIGKVIAFILEDKEQTINILQSPTEMFQQTTPTGTLASAK